MAAKSNSANGAVLSPRATQTETASGRYVDLLSPDPATLSVLDIGRHLSRTCRYGGALRDDVEHYSVAEHCVLVHDLMRWQGARGGDLLGALMHDAPEAYLCDVPSPLKYALRHRELVRSGGFAADATQDELDRWWSEWRSSYDDLTERMELAVSEAFGVSIESMSSPALKTADMWALKIEAAALTFSGGAEWRWPGELPNGGALPAGVHWDAGLLPSAAYTRWTETLGALCGGEVLFETPTDMGAR